MSDMTKMKEPDEIEQAKAIIARHEKCQHLRASIKQLEHKLKIVTAKKGVEWKVTLTLEKNSNEYWSSRNVDHDFHIPVGLVQQQIIDEIKGIERQIIQLGEMP